VKLSKEQVMVVKGMEEHGTSVRQLARQLGVSEGTLRYRLKRLGEPECVDARTRQPTALDGYEEVVEINLSPIKTDEGLLISAAIRDITERHALEAQLRQSQKMEAVGRLTGGVAHDFNNVLSVILSHVQLTAASLEPGQDALADTLREIEGAAHRGAEMVKQFLSLSRRAELRLAPTDLRRVVTGAASMLRHVIPEYVEIELSADDPVPTVLADIRCVEQALLNLAINARDAMPRGGKLHLAVMSARLDETYRETHPWAKPGEYACISVSDTGVGMDEATQARIFEPFFTTKAPGAGTGLGMAMVYGLVKQQRIGIIGAWRPLPAPVST